MRALILAAGRGERMRPLSDICPKPLLAARGKPLVVWHIEALARAGVRDIVVNTAWLEEQFPAALGDGARWGVRLRFSMEGRDHGGALETAGGIAKALPWLAPRGDEAFWLVSGDIHAPDFDFAATHPAAFERSDDLAHLWLVPNPPFHRDGDFHLDAAAGRLRREPLDTPHAWTYANIALARPALVAGVRAGERAALGPLLFDAAAQGRLGGETLTGRWDNLGTPDQLRALNTPSS
jgi:MurNAc alpha-1-phosphate uridylyltransferase